MPVRKTLGESFVIFMLVELFKIKYSVRKWVDPFIKTAHLVGVRRTPEQRQSMSGAYSSSRKDVVAAAKSGRILDLDDISYSKGIIKNLLETRTATKREIGLAIYSVAAACEKPPTAFSKVIPSEDEETIIVKKEATSIAEESAPVVEEPTAVGLIAKERVFEEQEKQLGQLKDKHLREALSLWDSLSNLIGINNISTPIRSIGSSSRTTQRQLMELEKVLKNISSKLDKTNLLLSKLVEVWK